MESNEGVEYAYDSLGNRVLEKDILETRERTQENRRTMEWDAANRLVSGTRGTDWSLYRSEYTYNGQWANKHEFNAWGYNTKSPTYNYDPMYRSTEPYFTGHQFDGSLNIYYADHRFYDAETGTWLSPDPVKDGLNGYQYCGNK